MSTQQPKLTIRARRNSAGHLLLRLSRLGRRLEYCFSYLTWKIQMFLSSFNANDSLIWFFATIGTSALGNPVVLAALVSGFFVLVGKLIEYRSKRKSEAELAVLLKTQNTLLEQILSERNPQK